MMKSPKRNDVGRKWSAVAGCLWLGAMLLPCDAADEPAWPKAPGAVFAMRDANVTTTVVAFDTKGRDLMAFNCFQRGRSLLGSSFEMVCAGGSFHAKDAGAWIGMQVAKSGTFTLEATLTPLAVPPAKPGVVLAYADDKAEEVALMQDKEGLSLRLAGGKPVALFAPEAGKPVHVVVACDKTKWTAYRDGKPAGSGALPGDRPAWSTREFVMGAAWSGNDPWFGRMEAVAVFPRALTAEEAAAEAAASKSLRADRKAPAVIRFQGSLVRQGETSALQDIRPYTRSLTVAEYKVDKVLAGEWKQPTIVVLHWMIMDSQRLPIADRKPGAKVELSVERLTDNPQLESCRRDELTDGDLDAELFYCESES